MNEKFKADCLTAVNDFILNSTRFNVDGISLSNFEAELFSFEVRAHFTMVWRGFTSCVVGNANGNSETIYCNSADEFSKNIATHGQIELSRDFILDDLLNLVNTNEYGYIHDDHLLHEYEKKIHYQHSCPNCNGRGTLSCGPCNGSGRVSCSSCGGSGQHYKQRTYYDNYNQTTRTEGYYESCHSCSGGKVRCSNCNGTGTVTCGNCAGTGRVTDICTIKAFAVPDYQLAFFTEDVPQHTKEALYKAGIHNLGQYGEVKFLEAGAGAANRQVFAKYYLEVPFATFSTQIKQSSVPWVLYGDNPHIFDAGHALEILLEADLESLKALANSKIKYWPWMSSRIRGPINDFMKSEIHQKLLDQNIKENKVDRLRESLNRAFSTDYIENSLTSLKHLLKIFCRWSSFKWFIASLLIVFVTMTQLITVDFKHKNNYSDSNTYGTEPIYIPKIKDLSHLKSWGSFEHQLYIFKKSILDLCFVIGIKPGFCFILLALIGKKYRNWWIKRNGGKSLLTWSMHKKVNKSRWLIYFFSGWACTAILFYFFPPWLSNGGLIYGFMPTP